MSYYTFEQLASLGSKKEGEQSEEGVVVDQSQLCYVKYDAYHTSGELNRTPEAYLPVEIRSKEQKNRLFDHNMLVVLVHADWCHPCQVFKPKFLDYAKTNLAKAHFAMENVELGLTPEITAVPCMVVYKKGGKVVKVIRGGNLEELTYALPPI
jgi:thiol-disulfide isomerase/thioredoxin